MKMTRIIKATLLVAMIGMVAVGCKKDAEEPTPQKTNFFSIDGTEYSLSEGFTEEYGGSETTGYNFDLNVISSGLDVSVTNGLTGQGEALYFELWSTSSTGLAAGTYTVTSIEAPNTFTDSEIYVNYNAADQSVDAAYEATSGSVTISVNGSTYSINFDLTITGGKKLTGNYTGALPNF